MAASGIHFLLCFFCLFLFSVVIIFNDWFLLGKSYSNATTLSKVINNQTKQNFPRFPSFRFWVLGEIENSEISEIFVFVLNQFLNFSVFVSAHFFGVFKSCVTTSVKIRGK